MPLDTTPSADPSAEIASLDPVADCERIAFLLTNQLFPFSIEKALEYALFKTYAVPSISRLLVATGEFTQRAQKRYDDTVLVLAEIGENGSDDPRAQAAIERMNAMHGRFRIRNVDFLYTLSAFVFEPIRFLDLYGPRPLTPHEQEGWFQAYRGLGEGMKIADLPDTLDAFRAWREAFERDELVYAPSNREVADATMKVLFDLMKVPRFSRPFAEKVVVAVMEPHVAAAFGYDDPGPLARRVAHATLTARRHVIARLPDRKSLRLQTKRRLPTYPNGYLIERLGTFGPRAERLEAAE